jgi:integrase
MAAHAPSAPVLPPPPPERDHDREVDRYRTRKVRERRLTATTINMTIALLAQILDVALEYHPDVLKGNAARGRRRRVKQPKRSRTFLEPDQIVALLDAAGELDREDNYTGQPAGRRAALATLVLTGLRIGELIELRWRDVDLAHRRIHVRDSKTQAGVREVEIGARLVEELGSHKASARFADPDDLVFATRGRRQSNRQNIRQRVLGRAIARAKKRLSERRLPPLPDGITPHSLRRTYISLLL